MQSEAKSRDRLKSRMKKLADTIQPSLRDYRPLRRLDPTLKGWAVFTPSLRDEEYLLGEKWVFAGLRRARLLRSQGRLRRRARGRSRGRDQTRQPVRHREPGRRCPNRSRY